MFANPLTVTLMRLTNKIHLAQILAIIWTGFPVCVKKDIIMAIIPQKIVVSTTHPIMNVVRII